MQFKENVRSEAPYKNSRRHTVQILCSANILTPATQFYILLKCDNIIASKANHSNILYIHFTEKLNDYAKAGTYCYFLYYIDFA